jgi:ubiquinone/menaquinone biosynthesis C-methylase UbiE
MQRLAPRFADLDILEFGCGTGKNTETFAREARTVLGVDISEAMLGIAQARGFPASVALTLIEPGARWPVTDRTIDVVTASLVLEHVAHLPMVFAEAARVLRPGGWFWTSGLHPIRQWRGSKAKFEDADGRSRSPECFTHDFAHYVNAANANGFRVCEVEEPADGGLPRLLVMGFRLGM